MSIFFGYDNFKFFMISMSCLLIFPLPIEGISVLWFHTKPESSPCSRADDDGLCLANVKSCEWTEWYKVSPKTNLEIGLVHNLDQERISRQALKDFAVGHWRAIPSVATRRGTDLNA
jgi:hypothetical protein